ncbi:DUF502 domain-containing protein [bacterium]|nr:DUF502 domain-containing protein [bacterium]
MLQNIRKTLVAGLLVLAPITLTLYILYTLFRFLDGFLMNSIVRFIARQVFHTTVDVTIPGLGILALLALLLLTGTIARNYFGRKFIRIGDSIITRIPLINKVYTALREISEAILSEKREIFKKAVLFEYPRQGMYSIGFFTQDTSGPVQESIPEDVVSVFLPTTPNPTSGYLLFIPKKSIRELDLSVEEALKLVISGGSIHIRRNDSQQAVSGTAETGAKTHR